MPVTQSAELKEQGINGAVFSQLTEDDLRELIPNIRPRLSVVMFLSEMRKKGEPSQRLSPAAAQVNR